MVQTVEIGVEGPRVDCPDLHDWEGLCLSHHSSLLSKSNKRKYNLISKCEKAKGRGEYVAITHERLSYAFLQLVL